jgi:tetratricopeptide (TPR) repeat protein
MMRRIYLGAFVVGIALLSGAAIAGLFYSIRTERRLPPLRVYSALAGSLGQLIDEESYGEAIEELELMLRLMPTGAQLTHDLLGQAYKARGELGEAERHYRMAIAIDPGFAEAHNNLGVALAEQGRLNEAVAEVREALRLVPDLSEALVNLPRMESRLSEQSFGALLTPDDGGTAPTEIVAGRAIVRQFYRGELESLHELFAVDFAAEMPLESFIELHRTAARQLGAEREFLGERVGTLNESTVYVRRARFANHDGEVEIVVQMADDGTLMGFMLREGGVAP